MATKRYHFTSAVHQLILLSRVQILCCLMATLVSNANTEHFTVTRGFTENGSNKLEDIFTFPPGSPCSTKDSDICSKFDASERPREPCLCECPRTKSTFQLHNGKWRCIANSDIRMPEGCNYSFNRAQEKLLSAPLRVVDSNFFSYLYPARDSRRWKCHLQARKSFYRQCSGEWKSLSSPLTYFKLFVMQGTNYYGFQLNEIKASQYSELDGKIIKLFIKCKEKSSVSNGCLLFKMKGSFNCSTLPPSVATTVSTSTPKSGFDNNATTPKVMPTTSHNESKGLNNTVESPGKPWSPLTAITAGVVSAVVLFLVMLATVVLFLVRRGKSSARREAASIKANSGDAVESEYCDPSETRTKTRNFDLENRTVSNEIYGNEIPCHTYQPLIKVQGRNEGGYQSLNVTKTSPSEDDPVYSSPYQDIKLTSTSAKEEPKDVKLGIPCGQLSKESCAFEGPCQTDNGYEEPIDSELPDYVVII